MDIREYIALLEQRAEYEAAEWFRQTESEPISEGFVLPVKMVLEHLKTAEMIRDFA